jgi:bifunctional UDP-N-acetylglucosamine pyrophosphorylase/glucosamine-1-phosphate N-acetyltransferase
MVAVEKAFRRRANEHWLAAGVTLIDPETTYIDQTVSIGQDTVIWPNTYLQGETVIGRDCTLGPNTIIREASIGDRCRIEQAVIENTNLADGTITPPFSWLKT